MNPLLLYASAKLNLTLDILGLLPNGYHRLAMVMQSLSLCDRVAISPCDGQAVRLCCRDDLPQGEDNIALRAAQAFFTASGIRPCGVKIELEKFIPVAAGLGGGSADAAAVLVGLNHSYADILPLPKLLEIGGSLGADVPFCITGGTALAEGFGERLTPLPPMPDCEFVLVRAGEKASTQNMYALYDRSSGEKTAFTDGMITALSTGDLVRIAGAVGNAFDGLANREAAARTKDILQQQGALGTGLSGSGPTIFGIFDRAEMADAAVNALAAAGMSSIRCRPVGFGCSRKGTDSS